MTLERARCGLPSRTLAALWRLPRIFTHPQNAVDFAALLDEQPFGRDVAVDHAGRLQLDALLGIDATAHFPTDDRFAAHDVALHFPALGDENLLRGLHGADHGTLDLHDAVGGNVSHDPHPGADDRQSRDRITAGPALLGEQRHLRCPPSRASADRATC